jgi:hypothetical protein
MPSIAAIHDSHAGGLFIFPHPHLRMRKTTTKPHQFQLFTPCFAKYIIPNFKFLQKFLTSMKQTRLPKTNLL